ncbi:ABC transporter permease [Mesorhizobium sp. CN2-181]|uniref:ABC transporter permease n=1 Tax=Mesorhizobium yinganensis TaxID=3157707 RepID=UPI0032B86791
MIRAARRFLRSGPAAVVGSVILLVVLGAAIGAPLLAPNDPLDIVSMPFVWPGDDATVPLGTDMLGRDIYSGIVHGARVSLEIGFLAGIVTTIVGLIIGAAAGYFGGWIDQTVMRISELFQIMPSLLLTIAIVAVMGSSISNIVFGIAVTGWPQVARLVRAETFRIRSGDFVQAARVMGFAHSRILFRHVLPNVLAPAVVMVSIVAGSAILTESALAFLGLGNPNLVTWGSMIGAGREVLRSEWYMTAIPGAAIFITVLGLSLVGNGLNGLLNPRRNVAA